MWTFTMIIIKAYKVSEFFDLKLIKENYQGNLYSDSSSELFYQNEYECYLYILSHAVVAFAGYDELKISETIEFLSNYAGDKKIEKISEEFTLHIHSKEDKFGHNTAYLSRFSPEILKIVMLNISQSVTLDFYHKIAANILDETNKTLLMFIGKTLNVKNNIIDHLYLIGKPEETWEDEYLSKVDSGLRQLSKH